MAECKFTPKAEDDIRNIWRSIAPHNETAADQLLFRILEKSELTATQPEMGSPRPELSKTARLLVDGNYVIIYEPMDYGILVVAVVHTKRDIETWL